MFSFSLADTNACFTIQSPSSLRHSTSLPPPRAMQRHKPAFSLSTQTLFPWITYKASDHRVRAFFRGPRAATQQRHQHTSTPPNNPHTTQQYSPRPCALSTKLLFPWISCKTSERGNRLHTQPAQPHSRTAAQPFSYHPPPLPQATLPLSLIHAMGRATDRTRMMRGREDTAWVDAS